MPVISAHKGAYIIRESGDPIKFDAVTQETHTLVNDITEHPVETGANVTDHVRSQLDVIDLEVFISNAPITGANRFVFGGVEDEVRPLDLQPAAFVGSGGEVDPRLANNSASVLQFEEPIDYVSETMNRLRFIKENAELITVVTPSWDYSDMIIKEISMPRTASEGDGAKVTISFKQIRLVATKLVPAPVPTEERGKKTTNKGAKGTKDAKGETQKKSVLATVTDKLGNLLS